MSRPPRDLNALLGEIRVPSDVDRCRWARAFRGHLRRLGDADSEALLDFCIAANVLRLKGEAARDAGGVRRRDVAAAETRRSDRERAELLREVGRSFFAEDAARPIALSNGALREELRAALEAMEAMEEEEEEASTRAVEEAYDLVWQARCDYKVWKGGLHRAYADFLATKPSPAADGVIQAVIMSIL